MFNFHREKQSGTTLIEFIVYFTLLGILLATVTIMIWNVIKDRVKLEIIHETGENARMVLQTFTERVSNANSIDYPLVDSTDDSLVLDMPESSEDPTEFDLNNGVVRMRQNGGTWYPLTTDEVLISNLDFTHVTSETGSGVARISFTVSANTTSTQQEYNYTKDFTSATAVRSE